MQFDRPGLRARSSKTRPTFARLIPAAERCPPITLRAGGVVIEVRPGFDHALLRDVVAALEKTRTGFVRETGWTVLAAQ